MKAYILPFPDLVRNMPLRLVEAALPVPASGEVLIKVSKCAVCRTDLHVCEGDLEVRHHNIVPGHQVIGRVATDESGTFAAGERVGAAWLARTCGSCRFCIKGRENLCESPEFNGWTRNGGFAEYMTAPAAYVYRIPEEFDDLHAAPLMCAGIIGYRALRLTGLADWRGARIGIYGFGAAGHIAIQLARHRGAEVYVMTREAHVHGRLAGELGAAWVGGTFDRPPVRLDASIVFAPAGEIVPAALRALDKGGSLVLGGIHMSPIPMFQYELIYGERQIRSVANNTRADGDEFLSEAAAAGVRVHAQSFGFEYLPDALIALKHDAIRGSAVVEVDPQPTTPRV